MAPVTSSITFVANPVDAGCRILVDGVAVPLGVPLEFEEGSYLNLTAEPAPEYELDNWNGGEWFEADWQYLVVSGATVTAFFSHL